MKRDIENISDIRQLVIAFHERVATDALIGPFFRHLTGGQWEHHLSVMTGFWDNVLFFSGSYAGNPIISHRHLHQQHPLSEAHFQRWLLLFYAAVDELFAGEKALLAKQKAYSIAVVMQVKILGRGSDPL